MDLICIDGVFQKTNEILHFPIEGNVYTLRAIKRNFDGSYGLLLNEIVNPKISGNTGYGFRAIFEPNFHPLRFTTLSGDTLSTAMLDKFVLEEVSLN